MFEIWRDLAVREDLLGLFPEKAVRKWAEDLMRGGRVYSFSQALGLLRLEQMAGVDSVRPEAADSWRRMFILYVLPSQSPQIARLKLIFRNLRRLAFLSLDSHYAPSVVGLKLTQILSDPPALAKLALHDAELDTEEDELRGLEQHLYHDVYLSRASLLAIVVRENRLRQEIKRSLRNIGLGDTIEALARNEIQGMILTEDLVQLFGLLLGLLPRLMISYSIPSTFASPGRKH